MPQKQFVSRGGLKLQHALETWGLNAQGLVVLDVGSSTGGFVDCLLQNGASKVYSLDTAYGELAWKLRQNPKVVLLERTNILDLKELPEKVDLVTIDVTFTSLSKIIPLVKNVLKPDAKIVALLKPQYENQKLALKHKGVIPEDYHPEIIAILKDSLHFSEIIDSPILGGNGNKEYLILL